MLQVTQSAANVFRKILNQPRVDADVIRIVPAMQPDGQTGISVQAIDRPEPADQVAEAEGVHVVVAPELAPTLDDAVLDARETDGGADLFLHSLDGEAT